MDAFCRAESIDAGEPVAGSAATHTDVWIALEHDRPWAAKVASQPDLPAAVTERLMSLQSDIEGARVQLVRGNAEVVRPDRVTLLLGVSSLSTPTVVRLTLASADALLDLDIPAMVAALREGTMPAESEAITKPLVLVCTNGKRDRCCAKWGLPVYAALAERSEVECWQTTHLGGHRFAPTLLTLPDGLCYGRLTMDDLDPLVAAVVAGRVFEPERTLRGRTCLSAAGQAAEVAWRVGAGALEVAALASVDEAHDDDRVQVTLTDREGSTHAVAMHRRALGVDTHPSCAKEPKPAHGWFSVG